MCCAQETWLVGESGRRCSTSEECGGLGGRGSELLMDSFIQQSLL